MNLLIPHDKALHYIGGQFVALATLGLGLPWSIAAVAAVAVGKEALDHFRPAAGTCEVLDAVATIAGAVPIWAVWFFR